MNQTPDDASGSATILPEYREAIRVLHDDLSVLAAQARILRVIWSEKGESNSQELAKTFPTLRFPIAQALETSVLIGAARFIDPSKKSLSLHRLQTLVEEHYPDIPWHNGADPSEVITDLRECNKRLRKVGALLSNVRHQRNSFYAHRNWGFASDRERLEQEYPVHLDQLFEVVEVIGRILAAHERWLTGGARVAMDDVVEVSFRQSVYWTAQGKEVGTSLD